MPIDIEQFANTITHDAKLRTHINNIYPDLINSTSTMNHGPTILQSTLKNHIDKAPKEIKQKLIRHLELHYPHTIVAQVASLPLYSQLIAEIDPQPSLVFSYYNYRLLRFPMQLILYHPHYHTLERAINEFINLDSITHDYVIVKDLAYIEYIPSSMKDIDIPDNNWEVKQYKLKDNKQE